MDGVRLAFRALADPHVRAALDAGTTRGQALDVEEFLDGPNALFVIGSGAAAVTTGAIISALIEDVAEAARRRAARSTGARLDPPLSFVLDEIANLCPVPSLPRLMADGGGSGIATTTVAQGLSQLRDKWGEQAAGAI